MIQIKSKILSNKKNNQSIISFVVFLVILLFVGNTLTFPQDNGILSSAKAQMETGKFSEAIDLLNNYISAEPRRAEGYALRAECYDKTQQHYNAVLDWEKATKLDPTNQVLQTNLIKSKSILNANLQEKIKGHERELAINPSASENNLSIGKAYKQMEDYSKAEEYYDKYLSQVPETSPDEILRYTEILAKNNHIKKGERILKEYADKYRDDWRLQSKYGYFLMWNGKYRSAKKRFGNALEMKPYFKEAQDGWDIVSRKAYVTQNNPIPRVKEYPIDRDYRLLKKDTSNDKIRLRLAEELKQADRVEEAYNQYQILEFFNPDNQEYEKLLNDFYVYRDSVYHYRIKGLHEELAKNPMDKKAFLKLAEYYGLLEEYDNEVMAFERYLEIVPNEKDPNLLFEYSKALAWNRDLDQSFKLLDNLIKEHPNILEYKLFRAQLSVWEDRDLELAETYVNVVLSASPNNVDAMIAKASLLGMKKDFDSAQSYINRISAIDPVNFDLMTLKSKLDFQKLRAEEDARFKVLEHGRKLVQKGDCESALSYYEVYLAQARPNNRIKKEYGDVQFCAEKYDDAMATYNSVLGDGYMYEAELQRGKLYYTIGDSVKAVNTFRKLVKIEPYEFQPRLYLGDSYMKVEQYDSALAVYDTLLTWELDSTENVMVKQRISWIPPTGIATIFSTFPYALGLAPAVQYYSDNLSFRFTKVGARLDVGLFKYLMLGVSFYQHYTNAVANNLNVSTLAIVDSSSLYGFTGKRNLTTFKGHALIPFSKNFIVSGAYGIINTLDYNKHHETEITIQYDNNKSFGATGSFYNSDAQLILFSPYLIDYHDSNGVRLRTSLYRLQGHYTHNDKLLLSGYFDYIEISDDNEGNNFQLRVGSKFSKDFSAGYEYFFQNYKYRDVQIYYSPRNYDSHCLWGEYQLEDTDDVKLFLGGKLGYAPSVNQFVLEAHFNANYMIARNFNAVGNISFGQSSQYNSAYRYLSINLHAYWSL